MVVVCGGGVWWCVVVCGGGVWCVVVCGVWWCVVCGVWYGVFLLVAVIWIDVSAEAQTRW